ncbi:MAG: hypothetical protein E6I52_21885, partial [Chloroflexi bacterium]
MPVVRVEEVELEVLRRLMPHLATVEHDPAAPLPAGHLDVMLGAADLAVDAQPAPRLQHASLQPQPRMKRHLYRVLGRRPLEEVQDVAPEKRAVHAEFEPVG